MSIVPAAMPSRRRHAAFNPGPEEIPAHAAVEWSVVNADGAFVLRKPDKDDSPSAFFNTETAIPVNGNGYITKHLPSWALYHAADGNPTNGESLGTRAGFWELYRGYEGFIVWGGADGEKVYVQSDLTCRDLSAGGYYGYYPTRKVIGCCCSWCNGCPSLPTNNSPPASLNISASAGTCVSVVTGVLTKTNDCPTGLTYGYTSTNAVTGSCLFCQIPSVLWTWRDAPDLSVSLNCNGTSVTKWGVDIALKSLTADILFQSSVYFDGTGGKTFGIIQQTTYGPDAQGVSYILTCDPFYLYLKVPILNCSGGYVTGTSPSTTACISCSGQDLIVEITA
jgi:hypothetical protein